VELDDDVTAAVVAAEIDELDLYLTEPRLEGVTDVLKWWSLNAGKYPVLSRLALDKLSAPRTCFVSMLDKCMLTCYSNLNLCGASIQPWSAARLQHS
jgi:hypothetical protein